MIFKWFYIHDLRTNIIKKEENVTDSIEEIFKT